MRKYCTLFDREYASKGLVLYGSLRCQSSEPFELHVLTMDEEALWILQALSLPNVTLYPLSIFEIEMHLREIKSTRTHAEYCWGCASNLMEYLLPWIGDVTYLDADLMFSSDPKVVFDEIGNRSIAITPHRFPAKKKHMEVNGIFNVGWVTARADEIGKRCIAKWAAQCREWCFSRNEPGRFGDQKYLDTWPAEYGDAVCIIENPGVNLAPWNLANYEIMAGPRVDGQPVVFYHLHEYKDEQHLTNYSLRDSDIKHIYKPYIEAWASANHTIQDVERMLMAKNEQMRLQSERA